MQTLFTGEGYGKEGMKKVLLCTNCRQTKDPRDGDPPVTGCLSDINVKNVGRARMQDYDQQERRLWAKQEERENA